MRRRLLIGMAVLTIFHGLLWAKNILVIEPSRPLLTAMKKRLHREGYWVLTARRWQDALKVFKTERIDLVIVNHYLDDYSGIEAVNHIRNEMNSEVKIIFVAPELAKRKEGIEAGADDYLPNPVDFRVLCRKIKLLFKPLEISDDYLRAKGYRD